MQQGKAMTKHRLSQWNAIISRFSRYHVILQVVLKSADIKGWSGRVAGLANLPPRSHHAIDVLLAWSAEAFEEANARTKKAAYEASKKWWHWMDEQLRIGAGALHAFTKRDEKVGEAAVPVTCSGELSLNIRALLESDRNSWKEVWEKFKDEALLGVDFSIGKRVKCNVM